MARTNGKTSTPQEKETAKVPSTPANASTSANATATATERHGPTQEQIAHRAYEIFLARGGQPGNPEHDWHQAERELRLGRQ